LEIYLLREPTEGALFVEADVESPLSINIGDAGFKAVADERLSETYGGYRVSERRIKEGRATIYLVCPVIRVPSMSRIEFDEHWRTIHAPLALEHHVGMTSYRQLTVVDHDRGSPLFDGISILGFPDAAALKSKMVGSMDGARALAADVKKFVAKSELAVMQPLPPSNPNAN
jgi:uncharacterized protein (TIGR02118 family)